MFVECLVQPPVFRGHFPGPSVAPASLRKDNYMEYAPDGIRTHKPCQAAAYQAAVFTSFTTGAYSIIVHRIDVDRCKSLNNNQMELY